LGIRKNKSLRERNRLSILNIWVDPVGMDDALDIVDDFIEQGDKVHTVLAANPEKNFSVPRDPLLYESFRDADLLIPDGIGVAVAAGILHNEWLSRVPGCELMEEICRRAAERGRGIYLFGASEAVNSRAAVILQQRYPGLKIAGRSNGYLSEEAADDLVHDINRSEANILFVALGSPRQESWLAKNRDRLTHVRVCQGIGGTLDVITGNVKRAPENFRRLGLEWLYRLLAEPKRLKRQWVLPVFAFRVFFARIGL
jgi:N-acetylglucosaminyldiphosphoundecaprenol N-acetyl-beta-D-mannosaminyltransferase